MRDRMKILIAGTLVAVLTSCGFTAEEHRRDVLAKQKTERMQRVSATLSRCKEAKRCTGGFVRMEQDRVLRRIVEFATPNRHDEIALSVVLAFPRERLHLIKDIVVPGDARWADVSVEYSNSARL